MKRRQWLKIGVILVPLMGLALTTLRAESDDIFQIREDITVEKGESVSSAFSLLGSITVDGTVEDRVVSVFGNVTVGPTGRVKGDAISVGGKVIRRQGSQVKGDRISLSLPLDRIEKVFLLSVPVAVSVIGVVVGITAVFSSVGFVALFIIVLVLFVSQVDRAVVVVREHPIKSIFLGLLGFMLIVPVLVFLTVTIVGIPLAFVAAAVAMAALVLGVVAVSQTLGDLVADRMKKKLKPIWSGLLGLLLLFLVGLIPVLGCMIHLCVVFLGLGTVIQTRFQG